MSRWPLVVLVFFTVPIIEMVLLIEVGGLIGVWPTVGLVLLTAMLGVALLRYQGVSTLARGMDRMQRGELPAQELAEGLLLGISGALLLTPGFFTDAVGFVFLTPQLRAALAGRLLANAVVQGGIHPGGDSTTIEGEYEHRLDPEAGPADGSAPTSPPNPPRNLPPGS